MAPDLTRILIFFSGVLPIVSMKAPPLSAFNICLFEYPFLFSTMVSTNEKPFVSHSCILGHYCSMESTN